MVLVAKVLTLLALSYASFQDLKKHAVKDKVFIYPLIAAALLGAAQQGFTFGGSMLVQAFVLAAIGFSLRLVGVFGGADILALALAGSSFPGVIGFRVAAWLLIPMVLWLKLYSLITRKSKGPALPGITIGYLMLLSAYGLSA